MTMRFKNIIYFLSASSFLFCTIAFANELSDCNEKLIQKYTSKQKIDLISKVISKELSPGLVNPIYSAKTKVTENSRLTAIEASRIAKDIFILSNRASPVNKRIAEEYWQRVAAKKILKALEQSGVIAKPGLIEAMRLKVLLMPNEINIGKEVLSSALTNALAIAAGSLPIVPPKVDPVYLPKLSPEVVELLQKHYLKSAQHLANVQLEPWAVASVVTLKGRLPWAAAIVFLVIQLVDDNKKILKTAGGTILFLIQGEADLEKYEHENYNSEQIVDELVQEWIDAQKGPVDAEKIKEMRSFFKHQEEQGLFR